MSHAITCTGAFRVKGCSRRKLNIKHRDGLEDVDKQLMSQQELRSASHSVFETCTANESCEFPQSEDGNVSGSDPHDERISETFEALATSIVQEVEEWNPRETLTMLYRNVERSAMQRSKHLRDLIDTTKEEVRRSSSKSRKWKELEKFQVEILLPRYLESVKDMQEVFRYHIVQLYCEAAPFLQALLEESPSVKQHGSFDAENDHDTFPSSRNNTYNAAPTRHIDPNERQTLAASDRRATLWTYDFRAQDHLDAHNVHQLFKQARELARAHFPDAMGFAPLQRVDEGGEEHLVEHPAVSHGLSNLVALLFYPRTALTTRGRLDIAGTRAVLYHVQLLAHRYAIQPHLAWAFDAIREIYTAQLDCDQSNLMPNLHRCRRHGGRRRVSGTERRRFVESLLAYEHEAELATAPTDRPLRRWRACNGPEPDEVLRRCRVIHPEQDFAMETKSEEATKVADRCYSEWNEGGLVPMCDDWRTMTTQDYLRRSSRIPWDATDSAECING